MNRRSFLKSSAVLAGAGMSGIGLKELFKKVDIIDLRKWDISGDNAWQKLGNAYGAREDSYIYAILSESQGYHVKVIDFNGSVFYETRKKTNRDT